MGNGREFGRGRGVGVRGGYRGGGRGRGFGFPASGGERTPMRFQNNE